MKSRLLLVSLLIAVLGISGCATQDKKQVRQARKVPNFPTGLITSEALITDHKLFKAGYDDWEPTADDLREMKALEGKTIIAIFAVWCDDSQREVPRMLKLVEQSGVKLADLQLYLLDAYKKDPAGFGKEHDVHYVPTIIVFDGDKELGRVVEHYHERSLAYALAKIARRK